eukprot:g32268.t1
MPLARCELVSGEKSEQQGAVGTTQVECADGTSIEVIPSEGGHEIVLTCREGNMVKSSSDGHVEILMPQDSETPNYVACDPRNLPTRGARSVVVPNWYRTEALRHVGARRWRIQSKMSRG